MAEPVAVAPATPAPEPAPLPAPEPTPLPPPEPAPAATGAGLPQWAFVAILVVLSLALIGLGVGVFLSLSPSATPPGGGTNPPAPTPGTGTPVPPVLVDLCKVNDYCLPNSPAAVLTSFRANEINAPILNSFVWDSDPLMGLGGGNVGGPYDPLFETGIYAQRDGIDHGVGPIDEQIFFDLGEQIANALLALNPDLEGFLAVRYAYVPATAEQFVTVYDVRDPYQTTPPTMYPMNFTPTTPTETTFFWPRSFFPDDTCPDPALACSIP